MDPIIAHKIVSFPQLTEIRQQHPGRRIVHCHGVYDLFHYGHLKHFTSAKRLGDLLVVTLTPDRFVNKGPDRPRFREEQRLQMIASLEMVDYVCLNNDPRATPAILALRPNLYVKGPDYKDKKADITGGILAEEVAVASVGGKLVFTDDETESSTQLINQFFYSWDDAQRSALQAVKAAMPLDEMLRLIEDIGRLKVMVVGEPIIDSYVFCETAGISSKSPTVSARRIYSEDYAGGSLAIANHLAGLGCEVTLLVTHGGEPLFENLLVTTLNPEIKVVKHMVVGSPTPRKTRFLIPFQSQRIFELIELRSDQWVRNDPKPFIADLQALAAKSDVAMLADFGHGLFEFQVLEAVRQIKAFIALNVQTNSDNFGFNPFTKHARYDYLSIDERECRVAVHDRLTPRLELATKTVRERVQRTASVTLGTGGSLYFDAEGQGFTCPTFFKDVVDTTGAGDAYFALTSLLTKLRAPAPVVPFLGNCFAGLKTRIIGNKAPVAKTDLIRTVQSLLR